MSFSAEADVRALVDSNKIGVLQMLVWPVLSAVHQQWTNERSLLERIHVNVKSQLPSLTLAYKGATYHLTLDSYLVDARIWIRFLDSGGVFRTTEAGDMLVVTKYFEFGRLVLERAAFVQMKIEKTNGVWELDEHQQYAMRNWPNLLEVRAGRFFVPWTSRTLLLSNLQVVPHDRWFSPYLLVRKYPHPSKWGIGSMHLFHDWCANTACADYLEEFSVGNKYQGDGELTLGMMLYATIRHSLGERIRVGTYPVNSAAYKLVRSVMKFAEAHDPDETEEKGFLVLVVRVDRKEFERESLQSSQ